MILQTIRQTNWQHRHKKYTLLILMCGNQQAYHLSKGVEPSYCTNFSYYPHLDPHLRCIRYGTLMYIVGLPKRLELLTCWLRNNCSTNWAIEACGVIWAINLQALPRRTHDFSFSFSSATDRLGLICSDQLVARAGFEPSEYWLEGPAS